MKAVDGETCTFDKGAIVKEWLTGDEECSANSWEYECGGIYNRNYLDVLGNRDHDCFWECSRCRYQSE